MKISLFGLSYFSENKGCEALCYSFLDILSDIASNLSTQFDIYIHIYYPVNQPIPTNCRNWNNLSIFFSRIGFRDIKCRQDMIKIIESSDILFDFTEGDSFSDLYGVKRFFVQSLIKTFILLKNKKLVLGPQTYGPFHSYFTKKWASWIIKKAYYVYSRDEQSADYVKRISGRIIQSVTDVAMALKYNPTNLYKIKPNALGINVSSLLYNGGYNQRNQFNLVTNYEDYINKLLTKLCEQDEYNIYLVPHVICMNYDNLENDDKICRSLKKKYPKVNIIDSSYNSSELKSIISQMCIFTGARMHSTIASFSSSVPTIPFSYSVKFEGLFNSLNYRYVVDGKKLTTDEAVQCTLDYIDNIGDLRKSLYDSKSLIMKKMDSFINELLMILSEKN